MTDERGPEVAVAGHDRAIVYVQPKSAEAWLTPKGRSTDELTPLLDEKRHQRYELLNAT